MEANTNVIMGHVFQVVYSVTEKMIVQTTVMKNTVVGYHIHHKGLTDLPEQTM